MSSIPADALFINVLGDLDRILTDYVLKACWHFENEKDLTYITRYPFNRI